MEHAILHIAGDESGSLTNPYNSVITATMIMTYAPLSLRWIIPRVKRKTPQKAAKQGRGSEFKFHNVSGVTRKRVLSELAKENIAISAFSIQKGEQKIPSTPENYGVLLYNLFKTELGIFPKNIDISFDNYFTNAYKRNTLNKLLRDRLHLDTDIQFVDSRNSYMIQLADFVAGAINYFHRDRTAIYYDLIRSQIVTDEITTWKNARQKWLAWK